MKRLLYPAVTIMMAAILGCSTQDSGGWPGNSSTPGEVSITPAAGTGSSQVFTVQIRHAPAGARSGAVRILFNRDVDGRNACYLYFLRDSRSLALVQDSGDGANSTSIGAAAQLENSQCIVNAEKASADENNGRLILRVAIDFKSGFAGKKNVYLAVASDAGQPVSFRKVGEWVVP